MIRPIMLWMTSRSRSSLVSKIFAVHDIYWGPVQVQSAGYDTYENQQIKSLQKRLFKSLRSKDPIVPGVDPVDEFLVELQKLVPQDKRWSMKTGVEHFNAYVSLNPYNIFITRPAKDVADSLCRKRPGSDWDEAYQTITWRFAYMEQLQQKHGGVFVNTDNIINNDFSEIKQAIEYCDLEFDEEAARKAIVR